MSAPKLSAWERLYCAGVGAAFCYRWGRDLVADFGAWFDDDVLATSMNLLEDAAGEVASDRGELTRERFLRAALECFENELASKRKLRREYHERLEGYVARLRAELRP